MIQGIRLQHFRSYVDDSFEFSPSVNIIVGPNASGKTNLLESILVLARGGSYRAHDTELVQFGEPWARIDALVDGSPRIVKIVHEPRLEKTFEITGRMFKRLTFQHALSVVLFEPNHLELLTGSPEKRRDYLDELLAQTTPGYGTTIRAYRRVLAQRNALLKKGAAQLRDQLFPWNIRLSELGGNIVRARTGLVAAINGRIGQLYKALSQGHTEVSVAYRGLADPDEYESYMLRQLEARLEDDLVRGFTSFGPHREDLKVSFDGHFAEDVASRGETRTLVLGLKIIELELLKDLGDSMPLLLLDDVFSELDGARRSALTAHLKSYQTFITTTDADVVLQHFADHSNVIPISKA